jgi:hypothetical protein
MNYLPPFEAVRKRLNVTGLTGKGRINIAYSEFIALVKLYLRGVAIDEDWYLKQYPDVADAVRKGTFRSARHHFIEEGYFEGRRASELEVDEVWYVKNNPDVAAGLRTGKIASAREHFAEHGYKEGRLPGEF